MQNTYCMSSTCQITDFFLILQSITRNLRLQPYTYCKNNSTLFDLKNILTVYIWLIILRGSANRTDVKMERNVL
jgi:hypothetical protein